MMLLLLLGLPGVAYAFSTFTINCTAPTERTNFVADGNTRSTLDILWSCLFTVFTCTWTALHLNVPEQRLGRDPGRWGDFKWMRKRFLRKSLWMILMIIAPEYYVYLSFQNFAAAVMTRNAMKERAANDGIQWSLTHAYFANMGGFAVKVRGPQKGQETSYTRLRTRAKPGTKNSIALESSGDGAATRDHSFISRQEDSRLISVDHKNILLLLEKGILPKLPVIEAEEIYDKSKNDILVKSLAVVQILSVVTQVIARHVRGLAVSQLELIVTAFSFCAIVTYSALFYMPKDVQTPVIIADLTATVSFDEGIKLMTLSSTRCRKIQLTGFDPGIPSDESIIDAGSSLELAAVGSMYLVGALFGAIHCFAWNFFFPTTIEQTLWRVASATSAGLPIVLLILTVFDDFMLDVISICTFLPALIIYTIARLYIIVEVFRTLFFLPPSAFVSTWASNIPQVG